VQGITWVRYGPETVLQVKNTDTATNQQARVAVTSTNLVLTRVASGNTTTNNLALGTYTTLQSLAAAVNALGSGWSAQVQGSGTGDYGLWPSADLYVPPYLGDGSQSMGALSARGIWAPLRMHVGELPDYGWHPSGYLYRPLGLQWPAGLLTYQETGEAFRILPGWWRVKYTAGYTTVPLAVQEACAEWVAVLYFLAQRDPLIVNQVPSGGTSYGFLAAAGLPPAMPNHVMALLGPYRRQLVAGVMG
jgi:hypothetical protein